ncbi:hypothetical protein ABT354_20295 [Streptomyces sp. NPDC000594]|uniref:hypothetical protein n=1 Tax=Streptomyces sp. NPDC000594 TaxID=3154261 RepID=UPI00332D816B
MVRTGPSRADGQLIGRLRERDLVVSLAQLERWRRAGVLPRHRRRGLGRGRGSVSVLDDAVVEIAAALARHTRQGRDLRYAVIGWYAEAGRPVLPGRAGVPEPPWPAVREALVWAAGKSMEHRLLDQARAAHGDEEQTDALYGDADRYLARHPAARLHPGTVRQALEAGGDLPLRGDGSGRRLVHLFAAAGGADRADPHLLADALSTLMPPVGIDAAQFTRFLEQAEHDGTLADLLAPLALPDRDRIAAATEEETARARHTAHILAGAGGLYFFHGLLMPDTPALADLRETVDGLGLGTLLQLMLGMATSPQGFARLLPSCLHPGMAALAEYLMEVLTRHEHGILHRPGHPGGAQAYMAEWLSTVKALTPGGAPVPEGSTATG